MGIVEHPIFKQLTDTKWVLYGESPANWNFVILFFYMLSWYVILFLLSSSCAFIPSYKFYSSL